MITGSGYVYGNTRMEQSVRLDLNLYVKGAPKAEKRGNAAKERDTVIVDGKLRTITDGYMLNGLNGG